MTGPVVRTPMRRESDKGWFRRAVAWWRLNGAIVVGPVLIVVGFAVVVIALEVRGLSQERADDASVVRQLAVRQAKDAADTARAAKVSCQRSKALGPQLADYYARDPAFPRSVLDQYRRTIPRDCPK